MYLSKRIDTATVEVVLVRDNRLGCMKIKFEMCQGWMSWLLPCRHDAFPDSDKQCVDCESCPGKKNGSASSCSINKQGKKW